MQHQFSVLSPEYNTSRIDPSDAGAPLIVGKISGQHGVKGWLKVFSYTRPVEQILQYTHWKLAERPDSPNWQTVQIVSTAQHSKKLLAKLAGVDDRDAVQRLVGSWVAIHPSQLARLPGGEYYWDDLLGLSVVNQHGINLGIVDHLIETGANDVLVVRCPQDTTGDVFERLLPWSPDVIVNVDVAARCIQVHWHVDD